MAEKPSAPGDIVWHDLTVENAGEVRDFYRAVIGWETTPVEMDGYADHAMNPPRRDDAVAGVCHARGINADLPPVWLIYVKVASLADSMAACQRLGGQVIVPPKPLGNGRYCVIRDPAGAVLALMQD